MKKLWLTTGTLALSTALFAERTSKTNIEGALSSSISPFAMSAVSDNGLTASYFNNMTLSGVPIITRNDAEVNFAWGDGVPAPGVNADRFSVAWEGQILSPSTETITFATSTDDGVKLYVNNVLVINNWTDHGTMLNTGTIALQANTKYAIRLEYYDNCCAAEMKLFWSSPSIAMTPVPSSHLFPSTTTSSSGLKANYYNNTALSGTVAATRTDANVNFGWGEGSPAPGVNSDNFSVAWEGQILSPNAETFTFATSTDDGVRLYINNVLVINNWTDHGTTMNSGTIALLANTKYPIRLEYYDNCCAAEMKLYWSSPTIARVAVPTSHLFPEKGSPIIVTPPTPVQPPVSTGPVKLQINRSMIIDEKAYPQSSPWSMFDEQSAMVAEPPTAKPSTSWGSYLSKDLFYPLSAVVDLGQEITVTNIYIYDLNGSANLHFYAKTSAGWELLFTDGLTGYGSWNKHAVNKRTRYVRIVSESPNANFPEVVMYGDKQCTSFIAGSSAPKSFPIIEDFLGLNILHVQSVERASIVKNLRSFHQWTWNEANTDIANYAGFPNNQYGFQPAPGTNWKFDDVYSNFKSKGMNIFPTLQGTAFWFAKSTNGSLQDNKPVAPGNNPEDPASFAAHADYLYQFSARYGTKQHPASDLKLQANNPVASGLGTVEGIENWNEPNKTWKTRAGMFTPYEYAAMTSADYDGHESKLGSKSGVKNADPNMPMILAGLTAMDTVYTRAMMHWFAQNRKDGKYPFDIINYHHYSNDVGGQVGTHAYGVSPEADQLERKVNQTVNFTRKYLPGKPVYITEFGYDVAQTSSQKAKAYNVFNGEDVQAMWLIRSYLAIYTGGADRAYMFWLMDGQIGGTGLFQSSGIISDETGQPRKGYYWLGTLSKTLGKYRLLEKKMTNNMHIASFESPTNGDTTIYCLWNGTSDGTISAGYHLTVPGTKAILVTPQVGSLTGKQTALPVENGSVKVTVTEDPIYVKVYGRTVNFRTEEEEVTLSSLVEMYPNPSSDVTYISAPKGTTLQSVNVYDLRGNLVKSIQHPAGTVVELNTAAMTPGVYTVQISSADQATPVAKKLIVAR